MSIGTSRSRARSMARLVASLSATRAWLTAWYFGARCPPSRRRSVSHRIMSWFSACTHRHRAFAPREREHVEHLVVVELEPVVGHVHLERRVAVLDERRKLLAQDLGGGVGDDEMKGVVDDGLGARAAVVRLDHLAQRLAAVLGGEGDDGGGTAERGGDRAGVEVVGAQDPGRRHLLDVAVAVDPPGQNELAGGVNLVGACVQVLRQRDDPSRHGCRRRTGRCRRRSRRCRRG